MTQHTYEWVLQCSKIIAPNVIHLFFKLKKNIAFSFVAGQFITIHIPHDGEILNRNYSIANVPSENCDTLEIICARVENGRASNFFFNMHPGDTVMSGRPRGNFILQNKSNYSRYILIATNSGVAPYRSMMQEIQNLMNTNTEIEVVLLFGIRKRENLFFKDDFLSFAKANPKFKFLICYSREDSIIDSSYERLGHVQDSLEELQLNAKKDIVYICGNPDMVNDVKAICFSKNFSNKNIIREKYSISKK